VLENIAHRVLLHWLEWNGSESATAARAHDLMAREVNQEPDRGLPPRKRERLHGRRPQPTLIEPREIWARHGERDGSVPIPAAGRLPEGRVRTAGVWRLAWLPPYLSPRPCGEDSDTSESLSLSRSTPAAACNIIESGRGSRTGCQ
jgi:hypothetical protein